MNEVVGSVFGSPIVASSSARLNVLLAIRAEYFGRESVSVNDARMLKSSFTLYFSSTLGSTLV